MIGGRGLLFFEEAEAVFPGGFHLWRQVARREGI